MSSAVEVIAKRARLGIPRTAHPGKDRWGPRGVVLGWALMVWWIGSAAHLDAQAVERVVSGAQLPCSGCSLQIEPQGIIGDGEENHLPGVPMGLAVNTLGHVYALTLPHFTIMEFSPEGAFIRSIGGTGDGPGEFRRPLGLLVGPGDSLFVFHRGGTSVFNREGEFVRQSPELQLLERPIRLESGHIVRVANPGPPVGRPTIHVSPETGGEAQTFGPVTVPGRLEGVPVMQPLAYAPSTGNAFWVAPRAPYRLERWNSTGELEFVLERRATHHRADEAPIIQENGRSVATFPYLSAVSEDARGHVWAAVVDELAEAPEGEPHRFESMVEAVDPATGRLLGSARVPGRVLLMTRDGTIVSYSEGELGTPLLTISRARVHDPSAR
jgi:hypothetical protein